MYQKNKIGVGILSKSKNTDLINTLPDYVSSYTYTKNVCDAWAKNNLLRMMLNDECEHLFILSDNITITNKDVFNQYISAASKSGLWCMQFNENQPAKNSIEYDNIEISFHENVTRSFFYIYRGIIKNIGFYDERYIHGYLDQIDLMYRINQRVLIPGWKWFPDLATSNQYITTNPSLPSVDKQKEYFENVWFGFKNKINLNQIPVTSESEVLKNLEKIKEQYGKNI